MKNIRHLRSVGFVQGQVRGKIATVRFTFRGDRVRMIGAGFWRKGRKKYEEKKRKINNGYEDDFDGLDINDYVSATDPRIPSPREVAGMLKNLRITIVLDEPTVGFFKKHAKKHNVKYQRMIREVLRHYATRTRRAV